MHALRIAVIIAAGVIFTWFLLAAAAGMFVTRSQFAVPPGSFTPDAVVSQKKLINIGGRQICYLERGTGTPVILLHGCPFSMYEWRYVTSALETNFRVIVPDLLGLGDTPVRLDEDYRLPESVKMVQGLMDHLGIKSARFIGHDHGGAIVQLLMQHDPKRIEMAVLTNVEAYDQWPSKPEIPDLKLITNPVTSPIIYCAFHFRAVQRRLYAIAVADRAILTDEMLDAFTKPHLANGLRWQRLRRFFKSQLDPEHNRLTLEAVPAMRRFNKPVLILWGKKDSNFGPNIAVRLAKDIPGITGIHWMANSAHLPMLEEPAAYSTVAMQFLSTGAVSSEARLALEQARQQSP